MLHAISKALCHKINNLYVNISLHPTNSLSFTSLLLANPRCHGRKTVVKRVCCLSTYMHTNIFTNTVANYRIKLTNKYNLQFLEYISRNWGKQLCLSTLNWSKLPVHLETLSHHCKENSSNLKICQLYNLHSLKKR